MSGPWKQRTFSPCAKCPPGWAVGCGLFWMDFWGEEAEAEAEEEGDSDPVDEDMVGTRYANLNNYENRKLKK